MKKVFALLLVLLLTVVGFVGAQEEETIKVGALFDLSGATGDVGTPYADGVLAYVDWVNSQGGIEGRQIELLSQDYAYSVETAENLYTQFVSEGVVVFHGWGTGDTLALRGRVASDEIPFVSASYSDELNDQEEAPYNFLVATTYGDQMEIMMRYMLQEWEAAGENAGDMQVVIFHNDSPFGTDPVPAAEDYAAEAGIGGVLAIPMPRGATDFNAELQTAVDFGVTHIIVQNVSSPAALLVQNAADFGLMEFIEFGCLNWCADELLVNLASDASEGVLGAIPFTPTTVEVPGQEIPRAYLEERGRTLEEASLHFTQGWAAMEVLMEGVRIVLANGDDLTGPNIKAALETLENFETGGLMAPVTFTPEDHRANRALQVYRVENSVWVEASDLIDLRDFEDMDME